MDVKRLVFKYWLLNLTSAVAIYIAYRIAIINTSDTGEGLSSFILDILDILLNLGFSLFYIAALVLGSFAIFLNRFKKIRENKFLSWLTFSGTPILIAIMLIISLTDSYHSGIMTKATIAAIAYPLITTWSFLEFRRGYLLKTKAQVNDKKDHQRPRSK
ncbi:hypothetical protein [Mucilaginibacter sp. KACC 22063]|uniref:hypothetical protein n=1 Tax=Mucilaginibacter sp. KACC 22063 TaxID=3025666 RepID=UPI002365A701|nr:hypothetical protein [Mucilaginibacter sp. KACC 22063]WDF57193.1 hypothetical protein PQ461_09015 [Mucilaginibacter sp. KACC 22063]